MVAEICLGRISPRRDITDSLPRTSHLTPALPRKSEVSGALTCPYKIFGNQSDKEHILTISWLEEGSR